LIQAQKIVRKEAPPSGEYPNGAFHSSKKIDPTIFSEEEKFTRFQDMCQEHMPFLYQLLIYKLTGQSDPSTSSSSSPTDVTDQAAETESNSDKDELEEDPIPMSRQIKRSRMVRVFFFLTRVLFILASQACIEIFRPINYSEFEGSNSDLLHGIIYS
jgi:hypothetical protein